jgi:hypothetical protein
MMAPVARLWGREGVGRPEVARPLFASGIGPQAALRQFDPFSRLL